MSGFKPVVEKDKATEEVKVSTSTATTFGAAASTSSASTDEASKPFQSDTPKGLHV